MTLLAFELLARFVWGGLFVLMFICRRETSERFTRIAALIACALTTTALGLLYSASMVEIKSVGFLVLTTCGAFFYGYGTHRILRISGFLTLILAPWALKGGAPLNEYINFFLGAFVLGTLYTGQYLGHWYLTVANLSIAELKKVTQLIYVSLVAKSIEVTISLYGAHKAASNADQFGQPLFEVISNSASAASIASGKSLFALTGDQVFGLGMFGLIVLTMRILWGLVAPLFLTWMVEQSVKERATQSATGILYAMCVMILIGECAALFLKAKLGWML